MIDDFSTVGSGNLGFLNPGTNTFTDSNNRRRDRALSLFDIAHRLVANYQYELPFGKGKRFLNQGRVLPAMVGGWSVNGITTLQSGYPISLTSQTDTTGSDGGGQRPDATGMATRSPGQRGRSDRQLLQPERVR